LQDLVKNFPEEKAIEAKRVIMIDDSSVSFLVETTNFYLKYNPLGGLISKENK